MDKRFIIALVMFYVVLTVYQSIFVAPKRAQELKKIQTIQANKDTKTTAPETIVSTPATKEIEKPTLTDKKEEITNFKTTTLNLKFTNVGGSLHNIDFNGLANVIPLEKILTIKSFANTIFDLKYKDNKKIVYLFEDSQWKIVKTFEIASDNLIKAKFDILNKSQSSRLEENDFNLMNFNHDMISDKSSRNTMLDEVSILEGKKVFRKSVSNKFNPKDNRLQKGSAGWFGFRDHFHFVLIKPEFETKEYENEVVNENNLAIHVKSKETQTTAGQSTSYSFTILAGNQDIEWLKTYKQDFYKIVAFSNWWILDMFALAIYYTVPALHMVCKSWGLSIILVSLLIYGLTYPLTKQSMNAMKKMQLVQPKIAALQKRYKDDPTKLNSEMVDLYRREKVNPLAGCLPFILQMPIFIALYQALWRAYYYQGQSFLWIKDLAQPDRLFTLPFSIPFLGSDFNILPILMAAVMFLQQSISSKNMVVTDEAQAMQQKMMKYIFPPFIGFIFYKFASGLSLYFTVFYALSTWTQWRVGQSTTVSRENKVD